MDVYVINLKHRTDRLEKIQNQCKSLNSIKLNIFEALEGDKNEGWKYCALSHLEIIKQNRHKNKNILVFEDDCDILNLNNFDEQWMNVKNWLDEHPDDWDIFNGGPTLVNQSKSIEIINNDPKILKLEISKTTHFIYYNKKSFDEILKYDVNNNISIDSFYIWNPNLKVVTTFPLLASQYESYSNITNKISNYSMRFIMSKRFILRFIN